MKNRVRFNSRSLYGLCPINCSCSEFPNGKPKRSRRLDDAGVNHLSTRERWIARDLQLIDRNKEFESLLDFVESSRELEGGFEVVHVGSKQRIHGREGLPSQLSHRTRLPRYRRPRDLSRDIVRSSWTSRKWRQCDCWLLGCMVRITLGCGLSVNAGTVWSVPAAIGPEGAARPASVETTQPMTGSTSGFS